MVASVSALTSSAQASSYYEADDYYAGDGLSPSEWQGKGAQELGLSGEVDRTQFRALLEGSRLQQKTTDKRDDNMPLIENFLIRSNHPIARKSRSLKSNENFDCR